MEGEDRDGIHSSICLSLQLFLKLRKTCVCVCVCVCVCERERERERESERESTPVNKKRPSTLAEEWEELNQVPLGLAGRRLQHSIFTSVFTSVFATKL